MLTAATEQTSRVLERTWSTSCRVRWAVPVWHRHLSRRCSAH